MANSDGRLDDDVEGLLVVLEALGVLLRDHHGAAWAGRVAQTAGRIRRGDASGIDRLLALYGGIGSLTDLVFHPRNGNATSGEAAALNLRFRALSGEAYARARALARHEV
jgi:hypothetical protein